MKRRVVRRMRRKSREVMQGSKDVVVQRYGITYRHTDIQGTGIIARVLVGIWYVYHMQRRGKQPVSKSLSSAGQFPTYHALRGRQSVYMKHLWHHVL